MSWWWNMSFEYLPGPLPPILTSLAMDRYLCPLGQGRIVASPEGIIQVDLPGRSTTSSPLPEGAVGTDGRIDCSNAEDIDEGSALATAARTHLSIALRWLEAYFATPDDLPPLPSLRPRGTPFQQAVWRTILAIPTGHTTTYGELSRAIQRPRASRAVGAACGANPLPLLIPCHRVVGSDGALTGFGGGLEQKEWLLRHEGRSSCPKLR